jgi:hypothetical protein
MAGHSEKKKEKNIDSLEYRTMIEIFIITGITILCYLYNIFMNGRTLILKDYISLSLLSLINYIGYNLLRTLFNSMWENIVKNLLILNLLVLLGLNYSYKAWFIYSLVPIYYGSTFVSFILDYVKGIGKAIPGEDITSNQAGNSNSVPKPKPAQKTKYQVVRQ